MSIPRIVAQLAVVGVQVFGKALMQASRQAIRNAQAAEPASAGSSSVSSSANALTRQHRMAFDEACNILNVQASKTGLEESALQQMLKNYEHLFKVNDPTKGSSIYLQSKVYRAKARIEAEMAQSGKPINTQAASAEAGSTPPPPPQ